MLASRVRSVQFLQKNHSGRRPVASLKARHAVEAVEVVDGLDTDVPTRARSCGGGGGGGAMDEIARLRRVAIDYYADVAGERARFLALGPLHALWKHQREGVAFLVDRERAGAQPVRGGILGDSMRAGKSLQVATLIVADAQHRLAHGPGGNGGQRFGQPTLIVAPTVNVATWRGEFRKHFGADAPLAVAVMARRAGGGCDLREADLVGACDVVITTYSTMAAAWRRAGNGPFGALLRVHFRRVVADEAHVLANAPPVLHAAMCAVRADVKWYVSGTPLQNSRDSLHNILRFLGVPAARLPSLDVASSRAMLRPMMLRRHVTPEDYQAAAATEAAGTGRPAAQRRDAIVLLDFGSTAERAAYFHVHASLLAAQRQVQTQVRERERKRRRQQQQQRGTATHSLKRSPPATTTTTTTTTTTRRNTVFDHLTRLRQLCVSPNLIPAAAFAALMGGGGTGAGIASSPVTRLCGEQLGSAEELLARLAESASAGDGATEPRAAAYLWLLSLADALGDEVMRARVLVQASTDPVCEHMSRIAAAVHAALLPPLSTKERWLVDYLRSVVEPAGEKLVVFSGWASFLDRLEWLLSQRPEVRAGTVRVLKAHGDVADRDAVLAAFERDPAATCLLVTHGTCATGVDLSCANHVVLCDPWWNPTVEDQAFARVLGVNQRRAVVHTLRLVMHETIDAHVVTYASRKRQENEELLGDDPATLRPPTSLLLDWLTR